MNTAHSALASYYRLHAGIYDATRWSFLFGRNELLRRLRSVKEPARILEVGCGTGHNLVQLAQCFPNAELTGIDLSEQMLAKAAQRLAPYGERIHLVNRAYDAPVGQGAGFDLVIASYSLSMFNPGWDVALKLMREDLAPGGTTAVVDFHDSRMPGFQDWMKVNHVRMGGHLRQALSSMFRPDIDLVRSAYGGVWQYFMFAGRPM